MALSTPYLLEASWEVAHKVGGIYTVLSSKLSESLDYFEGRYLGIGPLIDDPTDFTPAPAPLWLEKILIDFPGSQYGHWRSEAAPSLRLAWQFQLDQLNTYKGRLWQRYQLDTLNSNFYETDQPLLWSLTLNQFAQAVARSQPEQSFILHGHEWLCAGAFLPLELDYPENLHSFFTIHATVLGRALQGESRPGSSTDLAKQYNVWIKHQLEQLAAQECRIFTAVSKIAAKEAERYLSRAPDFITPNGLKLDQFKDTDQKAARLQIKQVAEHFLKEKLSASTVYQFSMGRYEFHNKGYDLYLEALARAEPHRQTEPIVAFFLVPADASGPARLTIPQPGNLTTHPLRQPESDPLLQLAHKYGLQNRKENRVKIIWLPVYCDGRDGIFNLPLYRIIAGFDLGVFPSRYEPWGYTPMESLASGVPTISSDRAGFSQAIKGSPALSILAMRERGEAAALTELTQLLEQSQVADPVIRSEAKQSIKPFSWSKLYRYYREAYQPFK